MPRLRPGGPPDIAALYRARIRQEGSRPPGPPADGWPATWIDILYRELPHLPKVTLPPTRSSPFRRLVTSRRSCRRYAPESIPIDALAAMVDAVGLLLEPGEGRRPYPSAGARYPIDTYLLVRAVDGVTAGRYLHSLRDRSLRRIGGPVSPSVLRSLYGESWVEEAAVVFVFVAQWGRSEVKYVERGTLFAAIEAGHMAQNLLLAAQEQGLAGCPLGSGSEPHLEALLKLVVPEESPVYAVAVGRPHGAP